MRLAYLSQDVVELPGDDLRAGLEAVERGRRSTSSSAAASLTAPQLLERFGFTGERLVDAG